MADTDTGAVTSVTRFTVHGEPVDSESAGARLARFTAGRPGTEPCSDAAHGSVRAQENTRVPVSVGARLMAIPIRLLPPVTSAVLSSGTLTPPARFTCAGTRSHEALESRSSGRDLP